MTEKNMDKQKLIAIAKDQLKGGIGEEQVRELLTYRGVEEKDVSEIMQEVLSGDAQPAPASGGDVIRKTDEALSEIFPDTPLRPEYIKKERMIIALSVTGFVLVVIAASVLYYLYF